MLFLNYLAQEHITLMILLALIVIILVNRKNGQVPGTRYYSIGITLLFLLTITDAFGDWMAEPHARDILNLAAPEALRLHRFCSAASNILRPLIIMIQVLLVVPKNRYRFLWTLPAIFNTLVYLTPLFGSSVAFWIDMENHWHRGPMGLSIYFVQLFYLFTLALFSIIYYRQDKGKRAAIIMLIVVQSVLMAILEYTDIMIQRVNTVTALGMLEYYFYLSFIYQQEMRQEIAERELFITRQQLNLLRSQIHPHFLFNSLSIIRSLAKQDSQKAVSCIDSFSDYLRAHINIIRDDDMIRFEEELEHIQAYMDLVQADSRRHVQLEYDLKDTDFRIPPLSLEPIVENAVKHGVGLKDGVIRIETADTGKDHVIRVTNTGSPEPDSLTDREIERLGVGLENTRSRLKMQCGGTLDMDIKEDGAVVTITIPKT